MKKSKNKNNNDEGNKFFWKQIALLTILIIK